MSLDKVKKCDEKTYVSPPINLRKFLDDASKCEDRLHNFFDAPSTSQTEADQNGADGPLNKTARDRFVEFLRRHNHDEQIGTEAITSVDDGLQQLYNAYPIGDFELTFPPKDSKLSTHKALEDFRKKPKLKDFKAQYLTRGRYFRFRESELKRPFVEEGTRSKKDIILTVHLLTPSNKATEKWNDLANLKAKVESRFVINGEMLLSKLVEKIFCTSDFWCNLQDFEDASEQSAYYLHRFPSRFLFIHDTFFTNADSNENAKDITEPIRDFLNRKPDEFGPYQMKNITTTKVIDLTLRLGQPYVFQHTGTCEHLLIFTDLRLLHPNDEQNPDDYPIKTYSNVTQTLCNACNASAPVFVIMESDRMPITPAFMCGKCFKDFHYDRKKRIGNFVAYHYIDRAGIE